MNDALLMRRFEGFGDLFGDGQRFVDGDGTLLDAIGECRSVDEFEHERAGVVALLDAVNLRDVGMVERRQDVCFTLETCETIRIVCKRVRQDFQRNLGGWAGCQWPATPAPPRPRREERSRRSALCARIAFDQARNCPGTVQFLRSGRGGRRRSEPWFFECRWNIPAGKCCGASDEARRDGGRCSTPLPVHRMSPPYVTVHRMSPPYVRGWRRDMKGGGDFW